MASRFPRKIIAVIIIGIAIRESLAPFTGHPFDFELWLRLGYYVYQGHDPYTYTYPIPGLSMPGSGVMAWLGYPPTWAFFQAGLYSIYLHSGMNDRFAYYFIVKQPMIIADILSGFLLYKMTSRLAGIESGLNALRFWMLCPFIIIISSVWGMFDQIILVILLTSALLISSTVKSASLEALGFLLKVIPLIYLPILALSQKTRAKVALYLFVGLSGSIFFSLLPYAFFPRWNVHSMIGVGLAVAGKISNSINYWSVVYSYDQFSTLSAPQIQILQILAYAWVPAILVGSFYCLKLVRKQSSDEALFVQNLLVSMLFITLIFFLTKSEINEQYVIYFLGFGLIDYYTIKSRERRKLFHAIWITALAFTIVNNTYLIRFLDPLSTYYVYKDLLMTQGLLGSIRLDLMAALGIIFSIFSWLYLRSLYYEIRKAILKDAY
ncbi:MAG: hypothetical protein ACYC7D_00375 [Nitrososphaerales archaeon]